MVSHYHKNYSSGQDRSFDGTNIIEAQRDLLRSEKGAPK